MLLHSSSCRSSVFLLALPKTSPEIVSPAYKIRSHGQSWLLGCTACISWTSLVKLPKDLPTQTRIKPYLPKRLSAPTKLQGVFPKGPNQKHCDPRSIPIAHGINPICLKHFKSLQGHWLKETSPGIAFFGCEFFVSLYHPRSLIAKAPENLVFGWKTILSKIRSQYLFRGEL